MAIDLTGLLGKVQNEGATAAGRWTAQENNTLVSAVIECQNPVKMIRYNGGTTFRPDADGLLNLDISENNYILNASTSIQGHAAPYKIALGSPFVLSLSVTHKFLDGDEEIPAGAVTAQFYCNGIVVETKSVNDGETVTFDYGSFLTEGVNSVYVHLDNGHGNLRDTLEYTPQAVNLHCSLPNFSETAIQSGASWPLQVTVTGSQAQVYIQIDNNTAQMVGTQSAGSTATYNITQGLTYGTHKLKVWAVYSDDSSISTEPIVKEYIYDTGTSTTPIIASSLVSGTTFDMYNVMSIPFWIYDPTMPSSGIVTLSILTETMVPIVTTTREYTFVNGSTGLQTYDVSLFDQNLIGERYVRIAYGGQTREELVVIKQGAIILNEVSGYDLYLSSAGRSNLDSNYNVWEYGNYRVTFPDGFEFNENGSGWNADANGDIACHIRRGQQISLNYQPFLNNPAQGNGDDVPGTGLGMTFSIELATRNCTKKDGSVVRCIYNGVGFEFLANSMKFASNSESLSAEYKEETHVRIDLVIEGTPIRYDWTDSEGQPQVSYEALMWVFVDGVYQQMKLLSNVSNFKQNVPQNITIGSDYCDVDVYCIRGYRNALNHKNITDNYAYDTPKAEDKIAIALRNDVFDSSLEISYQKLKVARPDLPIIVMTNNAIPTSKTWINLSGITFDNPANLDDPDLGAASFSSHDDQWRNQGSSSMNYPAPYRNYDLKFVPVAGSGTINIGGALYDKYRIYTGQDKTKSYTFKKNYASSEMANNAINSMMYSQMAQGIGGQFNVLTPAQKAYGTTKYRQSLYALPIYLFVYRNNNYEAIGQFDFLNYKTDEKHLGFVSPYTWKESRAQLWEIRDNNVFWDTTYTAPYIDADGNVINDIFRYYEARYPKESPTTMSGDDSADFGDCPTAADLPAATDETADLLRLHNWLASCNQRTATGDPIDWHDSQGNHYTVDNARYRLAKFVDEASEYLIIDSIVMYYIWREQLWMYDNGSKNFDLYTMDGKHWGAMARDCDTGLGIDNEGALNFPCYMEDVDYTLDNDFVLAPLVDTRGTITGKPSVLPSGAGEVCNGQYGALWVNIRDGFRSRIQQMYVSLYNNAAATKFNYNQAIAWYETHQDAWSEALFNYSSKQYHGGTPYTRWIASGLGDKKNQRRNWLYYGFRYRASKYHAINTSQSITFRQFGTGCDLQIIPYSQMYVCVGFGTSDANTTTRYRCTDLVNGITVRNELTTSVSDTIIYIYNADMYTDIGDLYKFGNIGSLDVTAGSRLRSLRIGSHTDKTARQYVNTNQSALDLTNCSALEELDLTNCEGFGTGTGQGGTYTLNLSNQKGLRTFYAYGSSLTGVTFAQTPTLETVELGANLRSLRLIGLLSLNNFSIQGLSYLQLINITDTPVNSYNIVRSAIGVKAPLQSVTVNNMDWTGVSASVMGTLASLPTSVLAGTAAITGSSTSVPFAMKKSFIDKWGDVDSTANALHLTYPNHTIENALIYGTNGIVQTGDYRYSVTPATSGGVAIDYGNDFKSIRWSVDDNIYCTINEQTGVLHVTQVGTETESGTGPTVTVYCSITKTDNTVVTAEKEVRMYHRSAYLGDYVYADGTYSDQHDATKTVIGICFYVNGTNRLMVARSNVEVGHARWGLYNKNGDSESIPGLVDDLSASYSWYDTPVVNRPFSGISESRLNDSSYRDATQPDGFRVIANEKALGSLGLMTIVSPVGHGWNVGDKINYGQYFTLQLINHRDRILGQMEKEIPTGSDDETETAALTRCREAAIAAAQAEGIANYVQYDQFYYPAASYCYAYEPTVAKKETLLDRFKAHNWWLPSAGESARMYWYHSKGYTGGANAIFSRANSTGIFTRFTANEHWSSSEESALRAWIINFGDGYIGASRKQFNTYYVRAVSAF